VVLLCLEIEQSICSNLYEIKENLADILSKIKNEVDDETVMFDIKLILCELVINGIIHGNCENYDKSVWLNIEVDSKRVKIEVKDEGNGFTYDKEAYDSTSMKCNGRGLIMVDGLSDELFFDRNKVISIKYIKKNH